MSAPAPLATPPQPSGPSLPFVFAGMAAIALFAWLGVPCITQLLEPVHARALVDCRPPTEHEQLLIRVVQREEGFAAECMYVGPRGAYHRTRR